MEGLLNEVLSRSNLITAHQRVVRNGGAAGVDGMKVAELQSYLKQNWQSVKAQIVQGTYRPQAVRAVMIAKPDGGERQLGIPTVIDRLIQQAIHQVLSSMWEPDFSEFSYGFRPGRNAHQAVHQALAYINAGYQEVIDLDLKRFFDRINHDKVMALIMRKVKDKALLRLTRRYLQSGILLDGVVSSPTRGTPQGGPLSPLLSNILLNELDKELEKRGLRFVRYADDCSIFVRSHRAAERVKASITSFLENRLDLEVNQEKTSICRPVKYNLLGYGFVSSYKRGAKGVYRLRVSPKSMKRLKQKLKWLTRKSNPMTFEERLGRINRLMKGWLNYFKYAHSLQKFRNLDGWLRCRLRYCIWKFWKKPRKRMRSFIRLGKSPDRARAWSYSRMGGWPIACSPIMGTTVTEKVLNRKGYESFTSYYLKVRSV